MTRVLQIATLPVTLQRFVEPLAAMLTRCGYQVEMAYGGPVRWKFGALADHHIPLTRTPFHPLNAYGVWRLARLMRARRYDIVHVHTPTASAVGRLAAHLAGVPQVIYTLHGSLWGTRPAWRAFLFDRTERFLARRTSHVFVFNAEDAQDMVNRCRFTPQQITRLPVGGIGVDLTHFDPAQFPPDRVAELRRKSGINAADFVIGYVGRVDRDKGIRDLLLAFDRLRRDHPHVRLLMVGEYIPGDRRAQIDALLARLGPAVVCTGFREDVPALMACMDVVALSSYREGFGMALAEAAAMGKPVVATATRGARAAVTDGVTGLLTPVGNVAALAASIGSLIAHPAIREQMGRAGRQAAIERFDRRKVLEVYRSVYMRLAGK